jgi:hypothetical protein
MEICGKSRVVYYTADKDIDAGYELTICYVGAMNMNSFEDRRDAVEGVRKGWNKVEEEADVCM